MKYNFGHIDSGFTLLSHERNQLNFNYYIRIFEFEWVLRIKNTYESGSDGYAIDVYDGYGVSGSDAIGNYTDDSYIFMFEFDYINIDCKVWFLKIKVIMIIYNRLI